MKLWSDSWVNGERIPPRFAAGRVGPAGRGGFCGNLGAARRRHRTQPARTGHRQQIQRAGEKKNPRQKNQPRKRRKLFPSGQHEQHHRVDEMIEDCFFPQGRAGGTLRQPVLEGVRAKRSKSHGQQSHNGGDSHGAGICHGY